MAEVEFDMPAPPAIAGRKPKTSIYVALLVFSLVALLLGCLFLFLEIKRYGGFGAVKGRVAAAAFQPTLDDQNAAGWRLVLEV